MAEPPPPSSEAVGIGAERSSTRVRIAGALLGVALVVGLVVLGGWLTGNPAVAQPGVGANDGESGAGAPLSWARPTVSAAGLADRLGVRITHLAVTGGGGLVDLRFQVVDPDKALALHDDANPPALVDEATGVVVSDLFMGHAHSGDFKAGVTYYLIFENPGNIVQRGGVVGVLLGNTQVEHVSVD